MAILVNKVGQTIGEMSVNGLWKACFLTLFSLWQHANPTKAGACWHNVGNNGRCQGLAAVDVGQEECCTGSGLSTGWTPHQDVSSSRLFYWNYLSDGAPDCQPCKQSCDNVNCGENKKCRIRNGVPRCVCAPDCSSHRHPHGKGYVCGDDGRTYKNYCQLLKYNCRRNKFVQVDYIGRCKYSCDNVDCGEGKSCIVDQNALPHCVPCQTHCPRPQREESICGANGITYPSLCHFRQATCQNGRSIGIAYMGACQENMNCERLKCRWGQQCVQNATSGLPQCMTCEHCDEKTLGRETLCGTDGNTYHGWCSIVRETCRTGLLVETAHYGRCGDEPTGYVADYELATSTEWDLNV